MKLILKMAVVMVLLLLSNKSFAQTQKPVNDSTMSDEDSVYRMFKYLESFEVKDGIGRMIFLKDKFNGDFTYVGEIKNGKPNGRGVVLYTNNVAKKYFGLFKDGEFSGRGTALYNDGRIVTGNWVNGKLNGTAAYLDKENRIQLCNFTNSILEGEAKCIDSSNTMLIEHYKNDALNGRLTFVSADGANICDNIYEDNQKNGQGYQYSIKNKKLYQGIWKDGKWLQASMGNFSSFLSSPTFTSQDDNKYLMLFEKTAANNTIEGTCFTIEKQTGKIQFGIFERGNLTDGMVCLKDNWYIGKVNNAMPDGYGLTYLKGNLLYLGERKKSARNGAGVNVSLATGEVFDGNFIDDKLDGDGMTLRQGNVIQIGSFYDYKLNGNATVIKPSGAWAKGEFSYGNMRSDKIKQVGLSDNKIINPQPLTVSAAVNDLIKISSSGFDDIESTNTISQEPGGYSEIAFQPEAEAWYHFPDFDDNHILKDAQNHSSFYAVKLNIKDYKTAEKLYSELCSRILETNITTLHENKIVKLKGIVTPFNPSDKTERSVETVFIPAEANSFSHPEIKVSVVLRDERYILKIYVKEVFTDFFKK